MCSGSNGCTSGAVAWLCGSSRGPTGPLAATDRLSSTSSPPLGEKGEGMSSPISMVALDIGPEAPLPSVKSLLVKGEADGHWYYEEGSISEEWRRL